MVNREQHATLPLLLAAILYSRRPPGLTYVLKHEESEPASTFAPIHVGDQVIGKSGLVEMDQATLHEAQAARERVDWEKSLRAAARLGIRHARAGAHNSVGFGFPTGSEFASPKPLHRWDGWAESGSRHGVQFTDGAVSIHINAQYARCVVAIFPPMAFGCSLGKERTRGDLFRHVKKKLAAVNDRP